MVFSSFEFLFYFLPAILIAYFLSPRRLRNLALMLASLAFYAIGGGRFILILFASIVIDYAAGLVAGSGVRTGNEGRKRIAVTMSVVTNLGLLAYFKYANFFVEQFNGAATALGFGRLAWIGIALPIGISFFTFQSMSYTIDVARERVVPIRNPVDFALYVSLFPQLIAGPIVRFHEIADQIKQRRATVDGFAGGALRFSHGLAKKVLIADSVAPLADAAFGADPTGLSAVAAWVGLLAYTVQIYFDFSGYSDMAIGMGAMFGFTFPENFARPYSALSITDFWRRWHITLSNWLRDYLYIPLGGSRGSAGLTYRNLVIVFLLTGLWHGANWTFVVWGVYHGLILVIERLTGTRAVDEAVGRQWLRRVITFALVILGWVFFRSPTVAHALDYVGALFRTTGQLPVEFALAMTPKAAIALIVGLGSVLLPPSFVAGPILTSGRTRAVTAARVAVLLVLLPLAGAVISAGTFSPFLYYQF
jgi:alginate O-acetyltransferase complex protein AlgI